MKEIPILFSTPMVQAILDGRKTMTRRVIKPRSRNAFGFQVETAKYEPKATGYYHNRYIQEVDEDERSTGKTVFCPFGRTEKGSILWVRETWCNNAEEEGQYFYKATNSEVWSEDAEGSPWKPSIHMPKSAARIWLEVTDVRVERLHEINETDAIAEGVRLEDSKKWFKHTHVFEDLWQTINGPDSWEANPWVWVVSFKVLSTTGKPGN